VEWLASVVIAIYVVLNATVFHFQRYTLGLARQLVYDGIYNHNLRSVAQIQMLITPTAMGTLGWLSYLLLAAASLLAYLAWGWIPVVALLLWGFAVSAVVDFVWPFPTRSQSEAMVQREIWRGMVRAAMADPSDPEFRVYERLLAYNSR
jgi:hypothetical protein